MSTHELKNVLNYIREKGSCTETDIWNTFVKSDTIEERTRVMKQLITLEQKGLINYGTDQKGFSFINYHNISYQ